MRAATLIDWSQSLDYRGSFPIILKHEEILTTPDFEASARATAFVVPMATVIFDQPPNPGKGFIALAEIPTPEGVIRLGGPKNTDEFARILQSSLRVRLVLELQ